MTPKKEEREERDTPQRIVLLTATGFATPAARAGFRSAFQDRFGSFTGSEDPADPPASDLTAAVITTASREFKERNKHAVAARDALLRFGISRVDFVDVEFEDAAVLYDYRVLYLSGGDPLYLMYHLNRSGCKCAVSGIQTGDTAREILA